MLVSAFFAPNRDQQYQRTSFGPMGPAEIDTGARGKLKVDLDAMGRKEDTLNRTPRLDKIHPRPVRSKRQISDSQKRGRGPAALPIGDNFSLLL